MKKLQIMMVPSLNSTRESMGFDDNEEVDSYAVLFQQGYDTDAIFVEDNEEFTIEEGYTGQVLIIETDDEGNEAEIEECYLIYDMYDLENKEEFLIDEDLEAGTYTFLAEHNVILG